MPKKPIDYILLSRPYTLPSIALVTILAGLIARGGIFLDYQLVSDLSFALATWGCMVYLNEAFHTDFGRIKIIFPIPIAFFIIALIIAITRNPFAVVFLFFALIATFIYRLKSKNWFGSSIVFLFRGLVELSVFFAILSFYSVDLIYQNVFIGIILLSITNARNLIGDVRDVAYDKFTFPKKFGTTLGLLVAILLIIIGIILTPEITIAFPLIIIAILIAIFRDGYFLHNAFVLTTIFYLSNFIYFLLSVDLLIPNLIFISVLLGFTYKLVTRRSNLGNNMEGVHY